MGQPRASPQHSTDGDEQMQQERTDARLRSHESADYSGCESGTLRCRRLVGEGEQAGEIERRREHLQLAIHDGPRVPRTVHVQLESIAVGILQIDRFADAVVGRAGERHSGVEHSPHGTRQFDP